VYATDDTGSAMIANAKAMNSTTFVSQRTDAGLACALAALR
jgi:hypothetical protein